MANDPKGAFLQLLGLARRAGRAELGEDGVGAALAAGKGRVVFLAADAAENSARRAAHFNEGHHAVIMRAPCSKEELGSACGRASCAMLAVTESGLAAAAAEKLAQLDPERYGADAALLAEKNARIRTRRGKKRARN